MIFIFQEGIASENHLRFCKESCNTVSIAAVQPRRLDAEGGIPFFFPGRVAQNEKPSKASFELRPGMCLNVALRIHGETAALAPLGARPLAGEPPQMQKHEGSSPSNSEAGKISLHPGKLCLPSSNISTGAIRPHFAKSA